MKKILLKKYLKSSFLFVAFCLILSGILPQYASAQSTPARLSFTPTSQTLSGSGRNGTIKAFLNPGGIAVASVELVINFNPNIVTVNNISAGTFFTNHDTPLELIKNIDNTNGKIHYAVGFPLVVGGGHSSTAQADVAIISFTTRAPGTSTFSFSTSGSPFTQVSSINATNILGGVTNGSVVVSGTSTPTGTIRATNTPTRSATATPTRISSATPTRSSASPTNISGRASLFFSPTSQTLNGTGRTGTVNVTVNPNGQSVASVELVISFNPSILTVNNISPGSFFTNSGAGAPLELIKNIDNTNGKIHYAVGFPLVVGGGPSSTVQNPAAVISFTTRAVGTSSLSFITSGTPFTQVSSINAVNILGTAASGSVVVSGSSLSPTGTIRPTNTPTRSAAATATRAQSPSPTLTANGARLSFAPTSQNISSSGRPGSVNVYLTANGENVSSLELDVTFNPQVIKVDNITPGIFFTQSNAGAPVEIFKNIDNTNGRIHYAVGFPLGSGYFSSASNIAAVINFTTQNAGTSTLTFGQLSRVSDINARNVLGSTLTGSIIVGGSATTPTSVPPITGTGSRTISAMADAYVSSKYNTSNYGKSDRVVTSRYDGNIRTSYLKFNVGKNVNIRDAQLRLKIALDRNVNKNFFTSSSEWSETAINFNNKPSLGNQIGNLNRLNNRLRVGEIVTIPLDASKLIPDADGNVSIAISNSNDSYSLVFYSKEEGHPAQLVITSSGVSSVTPTDRTTPTLAVSATPSTTANFSPTPTPTGSTGGICFYTPTGSEWVNIPISAQSGNYSVSFSATPKEINDSYAGLSNGAANTFTDLVSIIHFTHNGTIVARDEIQYAATQIVQYNAGQTYFFRLVVNSADKTYSAYVSSVGLAEKQIADNYSFRLEQQNNTSVNNIGLYSRTTSDGLRVCPNTTINNPAPTPPVSELSPTPPPATCTPSNGDANADGVADQTDYDIWSQNFNTATLEGPSKGDFDCSKLVNGIDYVIWLVYASAAPAP